ncbi:MAG TPA: cytochrome P450 [Candidatus Limnocylindria bacterium]|nr:cytochrome P450 [Candidatus Limnocylindria bacterium]
MEPRDVNLLDLHRFEQGTPHDQFALLRREAPVYWHAEPDGPGFWCITKYADVRHVSKHPELFSSQRQGTMIEDPAPHDLPLIQTIMLNMDPPQHRRYRALVNKAFTPRIMQNLAPAVEAMVRRIIDSVIERGECDFVNDIAAPLPLEVICELMGVPHEDRRQIFELGNRMIGVDDPELSPETAEFGTRDYQNASAEMFMYAGKLANLCRRHPGENLGTTLLHAEVDGHRLTELEYNSFFLLLAIAGNETTRTVTTNGMLALMEHPAQRRLLQEQPALVPSAVEEMIRFAPPVHHFRRTAVTDTEIRGVRIRENDKVVMWYPSANRDEEVFPNPDVFDVRRSPNEHLGFGIGEHYCLGANLARLELHVMIRELVRRLPDMELAAAPRRLRSNFINGVKEMRVRFTPQARREAAVA